MVISSTRVSLIKKCQSASECLILVKSSHCPIFHHYARFLAHGTKPFISLITCIVQHIHTDMTRTLLKKKCCESVVSQPYPLIHCHLALIGQRVECITWGMRLTVCRDGLKGPNAWPLHPSHHLRAVTACYRAVTVCFVFLHRAVFWL